MKLNWISKGGYLPWGHFANSYTEVTKRNHVRKRQKYIYNLNWKLLRRIRNNKIGELIAQWTGNSLSVPRAKELIWIFLGWTK